MYLIKDDRQIAAASGIIFNFCPLKIPNYWTHVRQSLVYGVKRQSLYITGLAWCSADPHRSFVTVFYSTVVLLPRDAMLSAVYAVVVCRSVCVCLSVCLSITLRYCIKTAKHRITKIMPHDSPGTRFLTPKVTAKFERDHPIRGRQMQVGWVKIGHLRKCTWLVIEVLLSKSEGVLASWLLPNRHVRAVKEVDFRRKINYKTLSSSAAYERQRILAGNNRSVSAPG